MQHNDDITRADASADFFRLPIVAGMRMSPAEARRCLPITKSCPRLTAFANAQAALCGMVAESRRFKSTPLDTLTLIRMPNDREIVMAWRMLLNEDANADLMEGDVDAHLRERIDGAHFICSN
jgi:hypothetical protein